MSHTAVCKCSRTVMGPCEVEGGGNAGDGAFSVQVKYDQPPLRAAAPVTGVMRLIKWTSVRNTNVNITAKFYRPTSLHTWNAHKQVFEVDGFR
jgi:hypothetical protein